MASELKVIRKGFGLRKQVAPLLAADYESRLVEKARGEDNQLSWPGLHVRIASEFGFCYGVDRAIDYAYETRERFPDKRLFLTGEIIHNPSVNRRLLDLGYHFLDGSHGDGSSWDEVGPEDVLLIPAFGVAMETLERMKSTGALLVDTTCGSVLNVWKKVERFARDGFTSLIHGKWDHEETRATASRAIGGNGQYLVVRNMDQTESVAAVIEGREQPDSLSEMLRDACSPDFDPERDLSCLGVANQTTMLSSESLAIAERIRNAMIQRYGEEAIDEHFRAFDTICSATEDRQAAVLEMIKDPPDLMIVIGGYNSSNTEHLSEMCEEKAPTFHVKGAEELLSATEIRHLPAWKKKTVITEGWLPEDAISVGVTAGASTPDREVGAVIRRLLELRGLAS